MESNNGGYDVTGGQSPLTATWTTELDAVESWLAPHFRRADLRGWARDYVRDLFNDDYLAG